ncbi:histone H1 [Salarias fasciatus]|uniref:Histone H1-like n=1 Tax=Salarias fasciatus TaxID=181472 RepID=A0A672JEG9_SALFA|nr:histone H1-like [Salarias fasciatus]
MSAPVIVIPSTSAAPSPKKPKTPKGPTVSSLVLKAVAASNESAGISLAGLKKVLSAGGYDVVKNKVRLATAIKRLLAKKALARSKGTFKINKAPPAPKKKKVVKKKAPAKKVAKKAGAKKSPKKAGKKSPKKASKKKKATSPKKAKKAAKKPKAPKKVKAVKKAKTSKKAKAPKKAKAKAAPKK